MPLIERALQAKLRFIANPANIFAAPPRPALTGRDLAQAQLAAFRDFASGRRSANQKPRKTR